MTGSTNLMTEGRAMQASFDLIDPPRDWLAAARASRRAVVAVMTVMVGSNPQLGPLAATVSSGVAAVTNVCDPETVDDYRDHNWSELLLDLESWSRLGGDHPAHDADEDPPSAAAIRALRGLELSLSGKIDRPDVWGPTGDGGFFVEQHDGERVSVLRVAGNGSARLTVFIDGQPGNSTVI